MVGNEWTDGNYIDSLTKCVNRCQVLRVAPFDVRGFAPKLPVPKSWQDYREEVHRFRLAFAKATAGCKFEAPPREVDIHKLDCNPSTLFQAAGICKAEGNELLKGSDAREALNKYEEGIRILDKATEVHLQWRLLFRKIHHEKSEENRKQRGLKYGDLPDEEPPLEFRRDEAEERDYRLALLLNAAQAALLLEDWSHAEARAGQALEVEARSEKALYRRGVARRRAGRTDAAKSDLWALVKLSDFKSKEALQQLLQIDSREEVKVELRKFKAATERERRLGAMLTEIGADDRVGRQEQRRA